MTDQHLFPVKHFAETAVHFDIRLRVSQRCRSLGNIRSRKSEEGRKLEMKERSWRGSIQRVVRQLKSLLASRWFQCKISQLKTKRSKEAKTTTIPVENNHNTESDASG